VPFWGDENLSMALNDGRLGGGLGCGTHLPVSITQGPGCRKGVGAHLADGGMKGIRAR